MMKTLLRSAAGACLLLAATSLMAPSPAVASTYSAVKGFSAKANPHGPWSYLTAGRRLNEPLVLKDDPNIRFWWNGGQTPNSALVGRNFSSTAYQGVGNVIYPDHLYMDPQSLTNVTVRFTVPRAGAYRFHGEFKGTDKSESSHMVAIAVNGTIAFTGTIGSFGQVVTFKGRGPLNMGDTIDFMSLTNGGDAHLSVGLKAIVVNH